MQYDIYLVNLDPRFGSEPDEINLHLSAVVIVPLTTTIREWPFRPLIRHQGKKCDACIEQIRVIDKRRLSQKKGRLNPEEIHSIKNLIKETYVD